jgi:hypothetical protein
VSIAAASEPFGLSTLSVSAFGAASSPKGGAKPASPDYFYCVFQFFELKNSTIFHFQLSIVN